MKLLGKIVIGIWDFCLDIVYPKRCISCKKIMPLTEKYCLCDKCLHILKGEKRFVTEDENGYEEIISPLPYKDSIRDAIIDFKFKNIKYLGYTFAKAIYNEIKGREFIGSDCVIIPVPIHSSRDRDYNQSLVISKHLSKWLNINILDNVIYKIKPIKRLSGMDTGDKKFFVQGAFLYNSKIDLTGKTVIVVDDVYTSGTTLGEISKLLRMYGASRIYAVTACHSRS